MKIININFNETKAYEKSLVALGNFDGVHRAHKELIIKCINIAKKEGYKSSVLLFKEHSMDILNSSRYKVLMSLDQKLSHLRSIGVDLVYLISFDEIKNCSPKDFIYELLVNKLNILGVVVGFDYKFGKNAKGNVNFLKKELAKNYLKIEVIDEITFNGIKISSSIIKDMIESDDLQDAEMLLGHEYWLVGTVIEGKKLGSKLGFPTANISLLQNYMLPSEGVYFTEIKIDGKIYAGATSLGKNLTLDEDDIKIEAHILDFDKNIYGKNLEIRFIKKIREMIKFNNLEDLTKQVFDDTKIVSKLFINY